MNTDRSPSSFVPWYSGNEERIERSIDLGTGICIVPEDVTLSWLIRDGMSYSTHHHVYMDFLKNVLPVSQIEMYLSSLTDMKTGEVVPHLDIAMKIKRDDRTKWARMSRASSIELKNGEGIVLNDLSFEGYKLPESCPSLWFFVKSFQSDKGKFSAIIGPLEHIDNKPRE